jgi:glycosyltransferase involved in cell wall biosynthesis
MTARIALLTEIPAPFRVPLFNALAAEDGVELRVLFLGDRDPKRPYRVYEEEFRYDWKILPHRDVVVRGRWLALARGVRRELDAFDPSVVIVGGWNQPAFWQAALWTQRRRRALALWIESTERDERSGARPLEAAKRAFVRRARGFIVPGAASREYVSSLGVADDRIVVAPNAPDLRVFGDAVRAARADRAALRASLGVDAPCVLYVGRLDPEKDVGSLLVAAEQLDATVVIAGGGLLDAELRRRAPGNVRFLGRLDRDELAPWYAAADVFVLPSRSEQWGMVVSEAAAAGLPLIVTDAVGAAADLVDEGVNGFRVPVGEPAALAEALQRVLGDDSFCERAAARSLELASKRTPKHWSRAVAGLARDLATLSP